MREISALCLHSQVRWAQSRFEAIREQLQPFLTQTGFQPAKVAYIPVGAMSGENLVSRSDEILKSWYEGPTLVEQLGAFHSRFLQTDAVAFRPLTLHGLEPRLARRPRSRA